MLKQTKPTSQFIFFWNLTLPLSLSLSLSQAHSNCFSKMGVLELWVILIFLVLSSPVRVSNSQNLTCNSNDLKALEAFLIGLDSRIINGWGTSNCCNWSGITCNSSSSLGFFNDPIHSGRVVKLELSGKRLMGKLNQTTFTGLDQLTTLNLSINFLRGSLPSSLFQLPNLQVIDLSRNHFSGSIPTNINLPFLEIFDISDNSFESSVPVGICINSTRIRIIDFAVNHFFGGIPSGFGNCSSLEHLWLGQNFLAGDTPEDIFLLPRVNQLGLQDNRFSGELSSGIDCFRESYKESVYPVPSSERFDFDDASSSIIKPPITKKQPGQNKKKRIPSRGENVK